MKAKKNFYTKAKEDEDGSGSGDEKLSSKSSKLAGGLISTLKSLSIADDTEISKVSHIKLEEPTAFLCVYFFLIIIKNCILRDKK